MAVPTRTSEGVSSYIRPGRNVIDLWKFVGVEFRVRTVLDVELVIYFFKILVLVQSELNDHILEYHRLLSPSIDIRFWYLEAQCLECQPILWVTLPKIIFTKANYALHKTTALVLR